MGDRLNELLERIPIIPIFLAVLGYFGWDVYQFHNDPLREIADLTNQITTMQTTNDKLQERVRALEKFKLELDQKRIAIRQLTARLDEIKANLPEDFDDALYLQTVSIEAKRSGLKMNSLSPGEKTSKGDYQEHAFTVNFTGVYHQVLMFLKRLTQLQTIIRVDSYTLRPTGRKAGELIEVTGSLKLKGFSYLRTQADSIAASGGAK